MNAIIKTGFVAAFMVVVFGSGKAHAIFKPGWERPIYKSDMKILSADNELQNVKEAVLFVNKRDPSRKPTSMTLNLDGVSHFVTITKTRNECGSVVYEGKEDIWAADGGPHYLMSVHLQDNTNRLCRDLRQGQWEASVYQMHDGGMAHFEIISRMELAGNREEVFTIQ